MQYALSRCQTFASVEKLALSRARLFLESVLVGRYS